MNTVALIAGYAFFWTVIGRIGMMAALLLGIGYLAVVIGTANTVLGQDIYAAFGSWT